MSDHALLHSPIIGALYFAFITLLMRFETPGQLIPAAVTAAIMAALTTFWISRASLNEDR